MTDGAAASRPTWEPLNMEEVVSDEPPQSPPHAGRRKVVVASVLAGVALLGLVSLPQGAPAHPSQPERLGPPSRPGPLKNFAQEFQQLTESFRRLSKQTHLSQECLDATHKLFEDMNESHSKADQACEDIVTENNTWKDDASDEDRWECVHARNDYTTKHEKHHNIHKGGWGKCDHEGFMHCEIKEKIGKLVWKSVRCYPEICQPQNMMRDSLTQMQNVPNCSKTTDEKVAACSVAVSCHGHKEDSIDFHPKVFSTDGKKDDGKKDKGGFIKTILCYLWIGDC